MEKILLEELVIKKINDRGVTLEQIAELTYFLQSNYYDGLTLEICLHNVEAVLKKREVQNAVLTGIRLDELAEMNLLEGPLQEMVNNDYSLYGIDEILAFSILNVYGSIGFTNYGYIDKLKPGILGEIDQRGKAEGCCQTFMDDLVGAIAAAAASRIAHRKEA
ncbi:phosphatidylglycerophosphatase A [Turicibacter sp. TJ11]|uniref:phosphatidylglycerophosphatase A family protein n=1 Tax=Turicibacter sp. TJ11 TaxID=2806443 RepID=UPI001F2596E1|nr:phosphatidylglycerophosphatase A [Turicibacter sp. TJ11]